MAINKKSRDKFLKGMMIVVPIVIGIAVFLLMSKSKKPPKQKEAVLDAHTVRVMEVKPMDVVPRVLGYGTAKPIRTWKAIAQVSGKIIYAHPQLQKGSIIRKGADLLKIDPAEYRINATKIKANIKNYEIQIEQLKIEEKNNQQLLKLQKTDLDIRREEVERQQQLYQQKIISKTEYESQLQGFISQEVQVQNIQNSLNLYPVKLELLQTQRDQARGDLESANLQLAHTIISAPFDIQVADVDIKISEFVQTGKTILEANDISVTEVEAQFVMKSMMPIFMSVRGKAGNVDDATLSIGDALGIKANVRIAGDNTSGMEWQASFNRRSDTLDSTTRTIGLIVAVKNRLNKQGVNRGRLLLTGAYCEVELKGLTQKDSIVIPRSAIHPGDTVLLMDTENKLLKKQVEIWYSMSDFVVIKSGIKAGDILILSDIIPAINGMKVDPVNDNELLSKLIIDAKGD